MVVRLGSVHDFGGASKWEEMAMPVKEDSGGSDESIGSAGNKSGGQREVDPWRLSDGPWSFFSVYVTVPWAILK